PQPSKPTKPLLPLANLMPFDPGQRRAAAIPFAFDDYLELVDSVGRVVRP
ncbi:MAG: transposase, partial [Desulfuromonadales bacterium]|nr:transposase [Desulfuromonadales bacterium]